MKKSLILLALVAMMPMVWAQNYELPRWQGEVGLTAIGKFKSADIGITKGIRNNNNIRWGLGGQFAADFKNEVAYLSIYAMLQVFHPINSHWGIYTSDAIGVDVLQLNLYGNLGIGVEYRFDNSKAAGFAGISLRTYTDMFDSFALIRVVTPLTIGLRF